MVIDRNDNEKYVDIWLCRGEPVPDVSDFVHDYPGYTVTVWHSGTLPLGPLTAELLRHNK